MTTDQKALLADLLRVIAAGIEDCGYTDLTADEIAEVVRYWAKENA